MEPGQQWVIFVILGAVIVGFLVKLALWDAWLWICKKTGIKPPPDSDGPEL